VIELRLHISKGDFTLSADAILPARGVTALFGPSGSGKTTILRVIAGLERHPGCSVKVLDEVWQDADSFVPTHRRPIGYVFQEPSLLPHLTVRGNLEYGTRRVAGRAGKVPMDSVVELLGLGNLLERTPKTLSGGEAQRVAIGRAVAVGPKLLLMDEPLSSLDTALKSEILPYLERMERELSIPLIYVSHSADEVARIADELVLLDGGRITAQGPIGDVLTRLDLPLAQVSEAEAVIEARVSGHDDEFDLTYLEFPGGKFNVPRIAAETGKEVRLRVLARDVSLTLEEQHGTSILNIFPAVVKETAPAGGSQITVRLDCGGVPLLARVTRKSASVLGLEPGKRVFAQAKSVAVLR
jgi:molybdate transport system ATP-binding protein